MKVSIPQQPTNEWNKPFPPAVAEQPKVLTVTTTEKIPLPKFRDVEHTAIVSGVNSVYHFSDMEPEELAYLRELMEGFSF